MLVVLVVLVVLKVIRGILFSKIALTSEDVHDDGYLLLLKVYQHSIRIDLKVFQTAIICSPVVIILLNSVWRLIRVCSGLI